ncbi:MAG: FtsX-like permease family protein [Micavibrio sp.]
MNDMILILSSLRSRWLGSLLSVFLTGFGVMLALMLLQFGHHVQSRLSADGQGIDIVVGAKGSPLQLILSSVYHIDIPTGNIPYKDAEKWMKHPQVRTAIPLALGDNWKGFRIAGTTPAYIGHYGAELSRGRLWDRPFEAVAGASVGLKAGEIFTGAHGLMEGGHGHDHHPYEIVGVLKPTGTMLDRLILTSLDSVLNIHGQGGVEYAHDHHEGERGHSHDHGHGHPHDHDHDHDHDAEPEITALLLTVKSPLAKMNLPRSIDRESALQAANPALEMARLTSMLGLGTKTLAVLSVLLVTIAALSILTGLAASLENRLGDLAILRALGYSKTRLFKIIVLEGMMIVAMGLALGVLSGLGGFIVMIRAIAPLSASGAAISFMPGFFAVIMAVLLAGLIAAIIPAIRASRVDVARRLSLSA